MEKKRGRGRPTVAEKIAGDNAATYERVMTSGKKYRSRRSVSDTVYAFTAAGILSDAASDIEDLELIMDFRSESEYMCRSVLSQLGRISREGFSNECVIRVAKAAIQGKKDGYSVKEIERYIRNGRLTDKW